MDRKEAYAQIKKLGLEEDVKKKFGKNFTQVSTDNLVAMINANGKKAVKPAPKAPAKKAPVKKEAPKQKVAALRNEMESCANWEAKYNKAVDAIAKFLAFMPEEILKDAAKAAKNVTPEKVVEEVNFSNADIDKMFGK